MTTAGCLEKSNVWGPAESNTEIEDPQANVELVFGQPKPRRINDVDDERKMSGCALT
jgi:hypothetical protein